MQQGGDWRGKIGVAVGAVFLTLVFAEACCRIAVVLENERSFEKVMRQLPHLDPGSSVSLRSIIQPSRHRRIIYELRPGISAHFFGTVRTNAQGWRRDKSFTVEKNDGTIRIAVLGDSYMFGQGVNQNQDAAMVLEELLNARFPQKKWEVINAAVPGYNAVMEIETLKKKLLPYKPDVVIIEYIANDFDLPNFIYYSLNPLDTKRSFFVDFIQQRVAVLGNGFLLRESSLKQSPRSSWKKRFASDPARVPSQYTDMIGWKEYVRALQDLRSLQRTYGFEVISLITWKNTAVFDLSNYVGFKALNNFDLPNFIYCSSNFAHLRRVLLVDFIQQPSSGAGEFASDPARVPSQYKDMVGWKAYVRALQDLRSLQRTYGFEVISLITWKNTAVFDLSKRLGFHTLFNDLYDPKNREVTLRDLHPNPQGHRNTAQGLCDFMLKEGLIEKLR